jgi:outer membrane lipoprotein LolB
MRLAATLVVLATLGGCAATPVVPPPSVAVGPSAPTDWTASGRLALAAHGEGGSGSFTWRQTGSTTTVSLRGPLGAGATRVTSAGGTLSVLDSEGRRLDDTQTRALLRERLGADLPWGDLRYWMLGVPAPGSQSSVVDAAHAPIRVIEQGSWRIAYDAFDTRAGLSLPTRFTAAQADVRVKVIVDAWDFAPAGESAP